MARLNRRQLVKTGTLSAAVALTAALLLIVNYFGGKYYKRFDWTSSHLYTLSEQTRNVLAGLKQDTDVIVFLPAAQPVYEPTKEVLSRYAAASPHLHVRLVDPEKNPMEAQPLVTRYQVKSYGVVVARGSDRRVIDAAELADFDFSRMQLGQQPEMSGFKGEQQITNAILQLSQGRKPKVLFVTGHGEHSLDDRDLSGMSGVQDLLGSDNYQIEEWASIGKNAVPPGTDLVVIAGPTSTFLPAEQGALTAFLNGGGHVLVLLDPTLGPAGKPGLVDTGLEGWLAGYGVKVGRDVVFDPANRVAFQGDEYLFSKDYGSHPITKALQQGNLPVILVLARSVSRGAALPPGYEVTDLLRTSPQGWGETDLAHLDNAAHGDQDLAGPVTLGVAVEKKGLPAGKTSRLVVIGDSDFATNRMLRASVPNTILLSNTLNWLVEREAMLGIPPKKAEQVHLNMTREQLVRSYLIVLGLLPLLALVFGITVYFRRRR
jgi:ABC-type uncharacterized transport system involved in gliding motility auxiliary subunit